MLLDKTFAPKLAGLIGEAHKLLNKKSAPVVVMHKCERFDDNTPDDIWVPQLQEEDWVILSCDLGRYGHPKLYHVCRDARKSLFEFGGQFGQASSFERLRGIFQFWPIMLEASGSSVGEWHRITYADSRCLHLKHEVKPWTVGLTRKSVAPKKKS